MADIVTTKALFIERNIVVAQFTNQSDGTGESDVTKVIRSSQIGPGLNHPSPGKIRIDEIQYSIQGFEGVRIYWKNTASGADETAVILAGEGYKDFRSAGGLNPTDAGSGTSPVGNIVFSTIGTAAAGDTYDITIWFRYKE